MKSGKHIVLPVILIVSAGWASAQNSAAASTIFRLQAGVDYYAQGFWQEALDELRFVEAEASSRPQRAEALFWIGMTELSSGDFEASLESFGRLETLYPENRRSSDAPYHKGRALFNIGRFEESIVELGRYIDSFPPGNTGPADSDTEYMKSAALFWIGESLFSMGHLDRAEEIFSLIIDEYPHSFKYEASHYRIALIAQKRVESELLRLLGWTHEESLRTMEEYQRREHAYEQALLAYQRRLADLLRDSRLSDLENENIIFRQQIAASEERIRSLENELRIVHGDDAFAGSAGNQSGSEAPAERLSTMRSRALDLMNRLEASEESQR